MNLFYQFLKTMAVDLILVLIPIIYICFAKKNKSLIKELKLEKPKSKEFLINSLGLFLALVVVSVALSFLLSLAGLNDLSKVAGILEQLKKSFPLLLIYYLIVRVFSEELFFRAFLLPRLGVMGSSIAFGLAHAIYGSIAQIIGALVLGVILAIALQRNQSLWPNILAHMAYNLVALMVLV